MNEQELQRLIVRLTGDSSSFTRMTKQVEHDTGRINSSLQSSVLQAKAFRDSLKGMAGQILTTVTGAVGGFGMLNTIFGGVKLAADAEKMESSFKVMLGSAEAATSLMAKLQQFAAETPLEMSDLTRFSKMLLQAGFGASEMVPTLRMLGDVAMGDTEKMHGLAYAFQQVKTVGRLMGGELIQMMNAGFNPLKEMSRTTGKSMGVLRQEMEKGLISFEMLEGAFKSATGEGGQFKDGMLEASKTLGGLFSTMMDDLNAFRREVGKDIVEMLRLKEVVAGVSEFAQKMTAGWKELPQWVKQAAVVIGLAGLAVGTLALVWPAVVASVLMFKGVLLGVVGPIGLVAAAVSLAITLIIRRLGGWQAALDELKHTWETLTGWVTGVAIPAALDWAEANRKVIAGVLTTAAAVTALYAAYRLLGVGVGVTLALLKLFKVQQIAQLALWLALKGVMLVYTAGLLVYNATLWAMAAAQTVYTGLVWLANAAVAFFSGVTTGATVATWLWNAALTVMDILLGSPAIIAAAVAVAAVAAAMALAGAAGYAAYHAVSGLFGVLASMSVSSGTLGYVTAIFTEWKQIVIDLWQVMKRGPQQALPVLEAAMALLVSQVKDLWPPLWGFIQGGFGVLADTTSEVLKLRWHKALNEIQAKLINVQADLMDLNPLTPAGVTDAMRGAAETIRKEREDALTELEKGVLEGAKLDMRRISGGFKVVESESTRAAREALKRAKTVNDAINFWWGNANSMPAGTDPTTERMKGQEEQAKKTVEAIHRLDATLVGSAAAAQRMTDYTDKLADMYGWNKPGERRETNPLMAMAEKAKGPAGPGAGFGGFGRDQWGAFEGAAGQDWKTGQGMRTTGGPGPGMAAVDLNKTNEILQGILGGVKKGNEATPVVIMPSS